MKRTVSLALVILTVFSLFSCSRANEGEATPAISTAEASALPPTTLVTDEKIKADGFLPELLPDSFVSSLPEGMTAITTTYYYRDEAQFGYSCDFTRIRLTCDSASATQLSNMLKAKQWPGGCVTYKKDDDSAGNAKADWIEGYWSNGEYCAVISESGYTEGALNGQPFTLSLDVIENNFEFPSELAEYFPAFEGNCVNTGEITVKTKGGKTVEAYDSLDGYNWRWDFGGTAPFSGVSFGALDRYLIELENAGFKGTYNDYENDYGNYVIINSQKTVDGVTYTAVMVYIYYLNTLTLHFTNNLDVFS